MKISRNNNPDFAEKLMSTFYGGNSLSLDEENECQEIWRENNNNRFEVLKKVVEMCGDINTSQTRYLRAIAWSYNSTIYAKQRVDAINDYLTHELYFEAFKNNVITLEKGRKKGELFHRATFLDYLATGYNSLKEYDKCESTYKEIIKLGTDVPNGYILLSDFYRKRGNLDLAIETLIKSRRSFNYLFNKDFRNIIDKKIDEFQKLKKGIREHSFSYFDTYPSTWINNTYRRDLEKAHLDLREKYKLYFEQHRNFISNIENIEFLSKQSNKEFYNNNEYEEYCINDIKLYTKINEFYSELNKLGFGYKMEYQDNGRNEYISFKKLINYYEKKKDYFNAKRICELAIQNGIFDYTPKKKMIDKIADFTKKENL